MTLEPTGERMVVEQYQSSEEDHVIYLMHTAAYRFAESFACGKRVLDFGCGSGYGADRIAAIASEVRAVDVAEDAIAYARQHFDRPNLRFDRIEAPSRLPFEDGSFDTVLSFQVLEHVRDTTHYLSEIRRVLVPGGCLVVVTPNRQTRLLPLQKPWNRWHVREYSWRTLRDVLRPYFTQVEIQHMSGRPAVVDIELRRCRRVRWLALPATLPLWPDWLRVLLLNGLHAARRTTMRPTGPRDFDLEDSSIVIGRDAEPSLNLVAIAFT
jgi:SAM-dependent methyltransferase